MTPIWSFCSRAVLVVDTTQTATRETALKDMQMETTNLGSHTIAKTTRTTEMVVTCTRCPLHLHHLTRCNPTMTQSIPWWTTNFSNPTVHPQWMHVDSKVATTTHSSLRPCRTLSIPSANRKQFSSEGTVLDIFEV